jgi:MSHA biogenesis protein MshJ
MNLKKWHELRDKTAVLTLRERAILMAVGVILVLFLWAQIFYLDFEKGLKNTQQEITSFKQEEWDQKDQLAGLMMRLADDPNLVLFEEQRNLKVKLEKLKEQIEIRLSDLIAPELMADVMRQVLSDYKGLRLVSAKNLMVEPLKLEITNDKGVPRSPDESQSVLFSHRFEMVLHGDYFQALSFLKSIEEMKGFYWTLLKYEVESYPQAKITLQLSTLSLDEDWIGV